MSDLISREEALKPYMKLNDSDVVSVYLIKETLMEQEPADVRENIHGEWVLQYRDFGDEFYLCNKCNTGRAVIDSSTYKDLSEFKFCPNCGARMAESEDKE